MLSIKQRQLNLRTHCGYYNGSIDGIEGNGTKQAYKNFQRDNGLVADGIYGNATNTKLISVIQNLQILLNGKGYNLSVDGLSGTATTNAVKDFQSKNGLVSDGIAGQNTYSKLNGPSNNNSLNWSNIKHFKQSDFTCKCGCGTNNFHIELAKILDGIRDHFGKPIIVTSGVRCPKHNAETSGSATNSRHIQGKAVDFYVKGLSSSTVLSYCKQLVNNGTLRYTYTNSTNMNGVVHIDIN